LKANWHKTVKFIKADWHAHPVRLTLETINWVLNVVIATSVSLTVPYTNWLYVYPVIFVALSISIFSAISRGSFGLLMSSLTLFLIDLIGFYRILVLQ
jgi:hypothetical protein